MGLCPASCNDITLISNPQSNCSTDIRRKTLSRIFFFPCSTSLPSTLSGNIKPLFDDGTIVASSSLANIVVNDPQTEEITIDECSPSLKVITSREITFEDRIAISSTSGSPATTNAYFDYAFWADKTSAQLKLNYMLGYCDGDVIIPVDENGNRLTATLLAFLSWQKAANQGGAWVEFKKGSLVFLGDPLSPSLTPAFNWIDEAIVL